MPCRKKDSRTIIFQFRIQYKRKKIIDLVKIIYRWSLMKNKLFCKDIFNKIWLAILLSGMSTSAIARVAISATAPISVSTDSVGLSGVGTDRTLSLRCQSAMTVASFSVEVNYTSGQHRRDVLCNNTEYTFTVGDVFTLPNASAILTATNSTGNTGSVFFQVKYYGQVWDTQAISRTLQIPAARSCDLSLPASVNLGSYTVEQIRNTVASNQKINLTGACNTPFSVIFSGAASDDGDFKLGNDTAMSLSYNYGANRIYNGVAFTPAANQIIDIELLSSTPGAMPAAGLKTTTLTATLNLL